MANLLNKANNILNEKNSKIKPNNIKKGVQIFDVTGTLDVGGDDIYDYFFPDLLTDGGTSDILKNAIKQIPTTFIFNYGYISNFLQNCSNLTECPDFEIVNGNVCAMDSVFQNCYNLESVPSLNWSGLTKEISNGMGYAYQWCYKLKTINNIGTCYPAYTYAAFQRL